MSKQDYAKAKGRAWEKEIIEYLRESGFPHVERRRLAGSADRGDISGLPGLVIEAKHERTYRLPEWVRQAEVERDNDGAGVGVVWARRNGQPGAGHGFVIMSGEQFLVLLREWYGG
ncbi:hypothetical protein Lfu02_55250 [Longispora fulva]|uniref:Holliday junction resolvase n=1 Tax=Longispora fulva TaxID=619741 RepID=A0A8J7KK07_9ACTN|nr:hypothetical protein [Longispora fulva]MBG6137494.1 hypothetical protein [Longispora fulva]GIG61153.1 hypothetical protein Lfu02_55250 [Longispora fulva]